MKQMSTSVSDLYETDLDIRNIEKAKKNEMDVDIRFGLLWNGSRHPFCRKNKKKEWNGCRHPFQILMKRISTSISDFYETPFWSISEKKISTCAIHIKHGSLIIFSK